METWDAMKQAVRYGGPAGGSMADAEPFWARARVMRDGANPVHVHEMPEGVLVFRPLTAEEWAAYAAWRRSIAPPTPPTPPTAPSGDPGGSGGDVEG